MNTPPAVSTTQLRIHQFSALQSGPRLIVLGAVHGNELAGTRGIERLIAELDSGALTLQCGHLTLVPVTNPLAYHKQQRSGERNLNRNLYPVAQPQEFEDRIANVLCPLLAQHDVLLDLHSFQSPGQAFAMIGPANNTGELEPFTHAEQEEALAQRLGPRRLVEGWLQTYAEGVKRRLALTKHEDRAHILSTDPRYGVGTTEYMRSQGGCAITLECGQHNDPNAPKVAYRAIRNTLAHLGLVDEPNPQPLQNIEFLRLSEVIDRHHADDQFSRAWSSFDPVRAGEAIGQRADGSPVLAPADGHIVFPNALATPGNEWFYFAQPSGRRLG